MPNTKGSARDRKKNSQAKGCDYTILNKQFESQVRKLVEGALTVQFNENESLSHLDEAAVKLGYLLKQQIDGSQFPTDSEAKASLQVFVDDQLNKIKSRKHDIQQIRLNQRAVALFDLLIQSPELLFCTQDAQSLRQWVEDVKAFVAPEKKSSEHIPVVIFLTHVNLLNKRDDLLKKMRLWCQQKILTVVDEAMDVIGVCVNDEAKVSTLPRQLHKSIETIKKYENDFLNYIGLLSDQPFSQEFNVQIQQQKKALERWIDLALEAGQAYNAKKEHLRLLKGKEKSVTPLPEALRGLRYVGEPSTPCGVIFSKFFVCMGALFFAGGLGWGAASLVSFCNSTLPLFFGSITFDAISPVASSLIIAVTCVALIALVLAAYHLDHHQKAAHFYNQFNLFHENQKPLGLETAYKDYQREQKAKETAKAVTVV